jgi:hypothetical protein
MTEDGPNLKLKNDYNLKENNSKDYKIRTKQNVLDSDGTIAFLNPNGKTNGTKLTIDFAIENKKPYLIVEITKNTDNFKEISIEIKSFIKNNSIKILNIAGHRKSTCGFDTYCEMVKEILELSLK